MKKLFLAASLLLIPAALGSCSQSNTDAIKIGCSGPLTGKYGIYGTAVRNSVEMAISEINAKGGLQFSLTMNDDEGDGEKSSQNFVSQQENGMQVSLGCVTSGACVSYKGADENNEMFMLTPSATGDAVHQAGVFQNCFSDSGQGAKAAEYIHDNYATKTIGVLYNEGQDYSKGIYETFKSKMNEYGISFETRSYNNAKDEITTLASQADGLKNCNLIFLPIYYTPATIFINNAHNLVSSDTIFFGGDGLDGIDGVEGFNVNSFSQEISMLSHFNSASEEAAPKKYVTDYTAKYGTASLNQFGASAYDCTYILYNMLTEYNTTATTKVDAKTSSKDIKTILDEKILTYTYSGVTGSNIKWNADHTVNKYPQKYVINPDRTGQ